MIRTLPRLLMAACLTASCAAPLPGDEVGSRASTATAPPGAKPGTCWGKDVSPAVVETVTEQILVQPAEIASDGSTSQPAIYKTETRQAIIEERKDTWFETPCAKVQTPEFVASLQRALSARGVYRGAITGQMDTRTRAAIRRFQAPQGLNSGILSMTAARKMGLVAVKRPE